MTETDFFRVARERMCNYSLTIVRESKMGERPYMASLTYAGKVFAGEGDTLPQLLSDLAALAGVNRRSAVRSERSHDPHSEDAKWPER